MTHYSPAMLAQCSDDTLRAIHACLTADTFSTRLLADTLAARVAELAAELARRETPTKEPK